MTPRRTIYSRAYNIDKRGPPIIVVTIKLLLIEIAIKNKKNFRLMEYICYTKGLCLNSILDVYKKCKYHFLSQLRLDFFV